MCSSDLIPLLKERIVNPSMPYRGPMRLFSTEHTSTRVKLEYSAYGRLECAVTLDGAPLRPLNSSVYSVRQARSGSGVTLPWHVASLEVALQAESWLSVECRRLTRPSGAKLLYSWAITAQSESLSYLRLFNYFRPLIQLSSAWQTLGARLSGPNAT